jgi:hypothetical protein
MSVDRRFREGLERNAQVPDAPVDTVLASIRTRAKRRRAVRGAAGSAGIAIFVVAALVLGPRVMDALREVEPKPIGPAPSSAPPLHLHTQGHLAGRAIAPGTYGTRMHPASSFTLGPGWIGFVDTRSWLNLGLGTPDRSADLIIIRLPRVEAVGGPNAGSLVPAPQDLAAWIAHHPGISLVSPLHPVTVGGLPGDQVDVVTGDANVRFGPIPGPGSHGVEAGIGANTMARVISVVVRGRPVLIFFGDSPNRFPGVVGTFEAVLGTLSFE